MEEVEKEKLITFPANKKKMEEQKRRKGGWADLLKNEGEGYEEKEKEGEKEE